MIVISSFLLTTSNLVPVFLLTPLLPILESEREHEYVQKREAAPSHPRATGKCIPMFSPLTMQGAKACQRWAWAPAGTSRHQLSDLGQVPGPLWASVTHMKTGVLSRDNLLQAQGLVYNMHFMRVRDNSAAFTCFLN